MRYREDHPPDWVKDLRARSAPGASHWWAWTSLMVLILGLAAIAMVVATRRIGERQVLEDIPHASAVLEIQSGLAGAQLLLEGFFTINPAADLTEVWRLLDRNEQLLDALLEGGELPQGPAIHTPLSDPKLRSRVEGVRGLLIDFRLIALTRVGDSREGRQEPANDELYDQVLDELLSETSDLETAVRTRTETNQQNADDFFRVILVSWALLIGLAVTGLITRELQRRRAERALGASEERLDATLRSIADGVVTTDDRGHLTFVNEVACKLLKLERPALLGRPLSEVYKLRDEAEASGQILMERDDQQAAAPRERLLDLPNGDLLPIEESVAPIRDAEGRQTGVVLVFRDVTQRKEAEAALRESEAQLLQSQKLEAIGRLAGGLAHDINNYLATISSESEQVKIFLPEDRKIVAKIDAVLLAVSKASSLLKRLLAFSRRQPPSLKVVSVTDIARELTPMLERLVGESTRLDMRLDDDLPAVEVDPVQLEQVLVNLVVNAREAMPAGGTITVATTSRTSPTNAPGEGTGGEPEERVVLSVSDTGCGIDPRILENIFEPFFTTKEKEGNSGLGLPTVHGIVNQCGGEIEIESEVGSGTEFMIHFPVTAKPAVGSEGRKTSEPTGAVRHYQILLVEDNPGLRRSLGSMIEALGHRVEVAADGEQALEIYRSTGGFDLVVTDFVLPGWNGREVLERIWKEAPDFPAIVISAHATRSTLEDLLDRRHVGFLSKPFEAARLAEAIEETCRGRSRPREEPTRSGSG